ncbi:MAG TPA: YceI family protein [Candidatus Acidoferrum sp.]|jgi:polyisoprenoid-binding protein YceI|nr:YceI family protein [Candidatus Acidoferrum sp.]
MIRSLRLILPLLAGALWAQPLKLHIDPAQTAVEYSVGSTLHTVHGTFKLKRGDFTFDPATGKASGELVVDAGSGESGSAARDRRMNESVLESARYPEIVFRPDRVDGKVAVSGHSQVQVHGTFALHGADHEMVVPVTVDGDGGAYTASATFTVPYIKWGLKNPSTFILRVNDKVEITVKTIGR